MSAQPILAGLRVIDAATYIAAPSAAAVLADFGADVIKIERPPHGDPFRHLYLTPGMPVSEYNYPFIVDNRNKRSLALNLADAKGREILGRLIEKADVFLTNYQPQMQARFRLRYEDLAPTNPQLIYASITGYGENGEEAERAGYDMTAYFARSGLMSYIHNADADPALSPCGFGDHPSAMCLFSGILLALYRRLQTGRGAKVFTTLMHNGVWSNSSLAQAGLCGARWPPKTTRRRPYNPLISHYGAADGKRFIFCLLDHLRDWPKLCAALERSDLLNDPCFSTPDARRANSEALVAILDAEFARHPLQVWAERFLRHDLLYGIVPDTEELATDRQMELNHVFTPVEDAPGGGFRTINSPIHIEGVEKAPAHMPPAVGQHSREVLSELGLSDSLIAELEAGGVVLQGGGA